MNNFQRLAFLDAIRGVACLLVMFQHILERISPNLKFFTVNYISFGTMGVISFFLVSGFVIPLSLERTGSIRFYFIKRFFRLYPLYAFVLLLMLGFLFFQQKSAINSSCDSKSYPFPGILQAAQFHRGFLDTFSGNRLVYSLCSRFFRQIQ